MKYTSSVIRMIGNKMTSIIPYTHETNDIWVNDSPYNEHSYIQAQLGTFGVYISILHNILSKSIPSTCEQSLT